MKNQLILGNIRSWHGINYIDLDNINLFFGSNSSGKSTILHALALLKQSFLAPDSVAMLNPRGEEIDLGRIEDQINKKSGAKNLIFGIRIYEPEQIVSRYFASEEHIRIRVPKTRKYKSIKTKIGQENDQLLSTISKFFNRIAPLDYILHYDQTGRLIKAEIKCSLGIILAINIKYKPKTIMCNFEADLISEFWDEFFDWESLQRGDVPESAALQQLQRELDDLNSELLSVATDKQKSRINSKIVSLNTEIQKWKNHQERNWKNVNFKGSNIKETKRNFFNVLQKEFSVSVNEHNVDVPLFGVMFGSTAQMGGILSRLFLGSRRGQNEALLAIDALYQYQHDLGAVPDEWLTTFEEIFIDFLEVFQMIGPHRERPHRFTPINTNERKKSVGAKGENVVPIIYQSSPQELREINYWMGRLELGYKIERKRQAINRYNLFSLILMDELGQAVELSDVGYGIGQILPIILVCVLQKNKCIAIEQPELHLHPKLQANLGDLFVWSAKNNGNRFFLESHSEHLVLRLQRIQRQGGQVLGIDGEKKKDSLRGASVLIEPWVDVASSISLQVVSMEPQTRQSSIVSVGISGRGDFKNPWPGEFFPERYIEKGLMDD